MSADHRYLRGATENELASIQERAAKGARGNWAIAAATMYLVFVAPLVPLMIIVRAIERSSWIDIAAWGVLTVIACFCAWAYRSHKNDADLLRACRAEAQRRIDDPPPPPRARPAPAPAPLPLIRSSDLK